MAWDFSHEGSPLKGLDHRRIFTVFRATWKERRIRNQPVKNFWCARALVSSPLTFGTVMFFFFLPPTLMTTLRRTILNCKSTARYIWWYKSYVINKMPFISNTEERETTIYQKIYSYNTPPSSNNLLPPPLGLVSKSQGVEGPQLFLGVFLAVLRRGIVCPTPLGMQLSVWS